MTMPYYNHESNLGPKIQISTETVTKCFPRWRFGATRTCWV